MSLSEIQNLCQKGKQNPSGTDIHRLIHLTIHQIEEGKSVFQEGYKNQEAYLSIFDLEDTHDQKDLYQIAQDAIDFLESNTHGHTSESAQKHLIFFEEVKEKHNEMLPSVKIFMKHVIVTITRKHLR